MLGDRTGCIQAWAWPSRERMEYLKYSPSIVLVTSVVTSQTVTKALK